MDHTSNTIQCGDASIETVAPDRIACYVARHTDGRYYATTWSGEFMYVELRVVSRWTRHFFGGSGRWLAYETIIDGRRWHGRHCEDNGSLLILIPSR